MVFCYKMLQEGLTVMNTTSGIKVAQSTVTEHILSTSSNHPKRISGPIAIQQANRIPKEQGKVVDH